MELFEFKPDCYGKDNAAGASIYDHGLVDPLTDGIDGRLIKKRDGAEHFDLLHPAVQIGRSFDDDDPFHPGLTSDLRIEVMDYKSMCEDCPKLLPPEVE